MSRLLLFAAVVGIELIASSVWLDLGDLRVSGHLAAFVQSWGAWGVRAVGAFAIFGLVFARSVAPVSALISSPNSRPTAWLLAGHAAALSAFALLARQIFTPEIAAGDAAVAAWLMCGLASTALLGLAFFPRAAWLSLWRTHKMPLISAAAASVAVCAAGLAARPLWQHGARATFYAVVTLLRPVLDVRVVPEQNLIMADHFGVTISSYCAGFEGVGLLLAFMTFWLWMFRAEYRFPRALLLLPLGAVAVWVLNAVRIAALLLIGNAGATTIATGGFHSQAGWIAFLIAAIGLGQLSRRMDWFRRGHAHRQQQANPAAPWLMPFLVLMGVSILIKAATADFEWLYPLRLVAVAAILVAHRSIYAKIPWKTGWTGPFAGVAAFVIWVGFDRWNAGGLDQTIQAGLDIMSQPVRAGWMLARIAAATITVPLAEELAFRGYLLRRMQREDFDHIAFSSCSATAVVVSSLIFGALHGSFWIPGTLAGLLFAAVQIRTGRFAEAVWAHAVANALLSAWVVSTGHYHLW